MGIIADDMAEANQRTNGDVLTDLRTALQVELLADASGKVWVNVDGVCALRIQSVDAVSVDVSARTQDKNVSA